MSDYICDTHIWGTSGTCVRPGCRVMQQPGLPGRSHPNVISIERRAQVVELLSDHTNKQIQLKMRMGHRQVARIRAEEAQRAEQAELR